jgi:deoxyribodipyrimidine photo-lyase
MTQETLQPTAIHWMRRDLRLEDNRALQAALKSGLPVICAFIFDREILDRLNNRADRRVDFIHRELQRISKELKEHGGSLLVSYGCVDEVWGEWQSQLADSGYRIAQVHIGRDYEPEAQKRDQRMLDWFSKEGIMFRSVKENVLLEKSEVVKKDGLPYTVFTPYSNQWKSVIQADDFAKSPSLENLDALIEGWVAPKIPSLEDMGFEAAADFDECIPPRNVSSDVLQKYGMQRDFPAIDGTSRLSLHLRFGTVSIRAAYRQGIQVSEKWINELIWRDFYQCVMFHFPHSEKSAFRPAYDRIPWSNNEDHFHAWCEGKTGYPLVDAGMRELMATGFMHNRVRMVVASFLCKHLLLDWRWGERHFAAHLLDFDLASNVGGWQWAAGSGCDAAPYFRVFNPTAQQAKFDGQAQYIRKWVPEFGTSTYPNPIVDHPTARILAIETYKAALKPE